MHAIHEGPRRVFDDRCEECVERSRSLDRIGGALDAANLRELGRLAREIRETGVRPPDASHADAYAAKLLLDAARVLSAAGLEVES